MEKYMQEFGPRVGTAIFIVRDGEFIFLKRTGSHGSGTWSTPGGHVEFGEDPIDTCKREAMEETGCIVDNIRFAFVTNDYFEKENKHFITLWYVGKWIENEPEIKEPHKCKELRWVQYDDMPHPRLQTYNSLTEQKATMLGEIIQNVSKGVNR